MRRSGCLCAFRGIRRAKGFCTADDSEFNISRGVVTGSIIGARALVEDGEPETEALPAPARLSMASMYLVVSCQFINERGYRPKSSGDGLMRPGRGRARE
jgi:hypothetical protein